MGSEPTVVKGKLLEVNYHNRSTTDAKNLSSIKEQKDIISYISKAPCRTIEKT
jgi:hypothetical protein